MELTNGESVRFSVFIYSFMNMGRILLYSKRKAFDNERFIDEELKAT